MQDRNTQLEEQENVIRQLEDILEQKDEEMKATNEDINKLSQQIWDGEDELERLRIEFSRFKQDSASDRESTETINSALKEVCFLFSFCFF